MGRFGAAPFIFLSIGLLRCGLSGADPNWSDLGSRYKDSIVSLKITKTDVKTGAQFDDYATGFVVGKDGYVLTTAHQFTSDIRGPNGSIATSRYPPDIYGRLGTRKPEPIDRLYIRKVLSDYDLALIQFESFSIPLKPLPIGKAGDVKVTDDVLALGFPLDLDYDSRKGAVSSKGGVDPLWNMAAPFERGLSGAPLLNGNGEVVAVVRGGDDRSPAIKYAVPINLAMPLLTTVEAVYAAGAQVGAATSPQSVTITKQWETTDLDAPGEDRITRSHTKVYLVPAGKILESADVNVQQSNGLVGEKVIVEIAPGAKVINLLYQLESGPKSLHRVGYIKSDLVMAVVPEAQPQ